MQTPNLERKCFQYYVVYSFYISIKSDIGSIYLNAYMSWHVQGVQLKNEPRHVAS